MPTVNMLEAKSNLSRLVEAVENGSESEIIIARNGRPAARLVPLEAKPLAPRPLGLWNGRFETVSQEEFDSSNEEIAELFNGKDDD